MMISILILVHNAPLYAEHTLKTVKYGNGGAEVIVLDNHSNLKTKRLLTEMYHKNYIDKLIFSKENTLFSRGNNIAATFCDEKSKYILLLNSDVEIRNKEWLSCLMKIHRRGVTALGLCEGNPWTRGDGYCFLIDRDLYDEFLLDEKFEWWWSITKLQSILLNRGYNVTAICEHEQLLHHYGGASGRDWINSKGMGIEGEKVKSWFAGKQINIIDSIQGQPEDRIRIVNISLKINAMLSKVYKFLKIK